MSSYVKLSELIKSVSITHRFNKDKLIFLNTSDVLEGKILTNHYSDVSKLKGQAKKTIKNGDILYSEIRPKNRRYAYVKNVDNVEDYVVSTKLMVLRNNSDSLWTDYLYHFLTYKETINYLQKRAENRICSFPQITFDVLKSLQIWLPDFEVQKSIAKVLSDLDAKIELNNKINQELEAMAKLLYDYWFVQFDFPNEQGKPYKTSGSKMVYNKELKSEIPEGWKVNQLSQIANIIMGQSPPGNSFNENKVGEIFFQGSTDFNWRYPTIRCFTTKPSRIAQPGDILLSVRAPVGALNIADNKCCIGRGLAALNSKFGYDSYLYYVMEYFKRVFDHRNKDGTTFGTITKDDLFSLKLVYPSDDLLERYDKVVAQFNRTILNNHKQNQQLAALRDWLLPMLMNGQVIVNDVKEDL